MGDVELQAGSLEPHRVADDEPRCAMNAPNLCMARDKLPR